MSSDWALVWHVCLYKKVSILILVTLIFKILVYPLLSSAYYYHQQIHFTPSPGVGGWYSL